MKHKYPSINSPAIKHGPSKPHHRRHSRNSPLHWQTNNRPKNLLLAICKGKCPHIGTSPITGMTSTLNLHLHTLTTSDPRKSWQCPTSYPILHHIPHITRLLVDIMWNVAGPDGNRPHLFICETRLYRCTPRTWYHLRRLLTRHQKPKNPCWNGKC